MSKERSIAVVGLGYVGMPIAVHFGKVRKVIGFDVNPQRVEELRRGVDRNRDLPAEEFQGAQVDFTTDPNRLKDADFIMAFRLVECMREGLAPDFDVYDAASWSAPMPLSQMSVARGSAPMKFPDFTRGEWSKPKT